MAGWIKMTLGTEIGHDPSDIVLQGDPTSPPKKGTEPPFLAHAYCSQTAASIKMPLGMKALRQASAQAILC